MPLRLPFDTAVRHVGDNLMPGSLAVATRLAAAAGQPGHHEYVSHLAGEIGRRASTAVLAGELPTYAEYRDQQLADTKATVA